MPLISDFAWECVAICTCDGVDEYLGTLTKGVCPMPMLAWRPGPRQAKREGRISPRDSPFRHSFLRGLDPPFEAIFFFFHGELSQRVMRFEVWLLRVLTHSVVSTINKFGFQSLRALTHTCSMICDNHRTYRILLPDHSVPALRWLHPAVPFILKGGFVYLRTVAASMMLRILVAQD